MTLKSLHEIAVRIWS